MSTERVIQSPLPSPETDCVQGKERKQRGQRARGFATLAFSFALLSTAERKYGISIPQVFPTRDDAYIGDEMHGLQQQLQHVIERLLPASQSTVVNRRVTGRTAIDIALELGISPNSVNVYTSEARFQLEQTLIFPAGYRRVASFNDRSLNTAASAGKLEAAFFLGHWYATREAIDRYLGTSGRIVETPEQFVKYPFL